MELEKVLLIGGSGFVGGWIASRLSERGVRVTIPTRHRDNTKKLIMLPTVDMVEAGCIDDCVARRRHAVLARRHDGFDVKSAAVASSLSVCTPRWIFEL